ncbi:cytochrome P450 [Xylaria flabelliformis]|nr:cytochrome P450 [Xylaria flabelliformis]
MDENTRLTTSIPIAFAIIAAVGLFVQVLQRLFFGPFRNIPGPWLNRVSELPAALALLKGDQHVYYKSLHDKYGPVVRVSPDEISFISVTARQEIYGFRKGGIYMEKSPIFLGAVGALDGQTGVSLALNEHHTRQRKALGYLFTNSALLQLETLVIVHIHKLVGALQAAATENRAIDVSNWYTYAAFDIMGDLCFAEPFGCLDQASGTEWSTSVIQIFVGATWTQGIRRISGVGTWLESIMTQLLIPAKAAGWRKTHLSNAQEKTRRRLADNDRNHTDFMHHILLNNESKKSLSETEIFLNMAGFVSGGTDTTATALTGWTYFVCTHPKVLNRLAHEVRSTFAKEDDIRWERVNKLRYLEATLQETLRLYPPSPASQQRIVPPGGATIDGYYIPGGKTVAVAPWVSTHSSLNFHEPDTFHPERWLGKDEKFSKDHLNASLPFGTGPRVCMGKNLAYLEMLLITAHILWNFDLELDFEEHRDRNDVWGLDGKMKRMKIFHSMTKPELWVKFRKIRGQS